MRKYLHYVVLLGALLLFQLPGSLFGQGYCKPTFSGGCSSGDSLEFFKFGSYKYAPKCVTGSVDTTQLKQTGIKAYRGKTYELRIKMAKSGAFHYIVYLDYNNDKDFKDDGEILVVDNLGVDSLVTDISIPLTATLAKTRIRIIAALGVPTDGGAAYCESFSAAGIAVDIPFEVAAYPEDASLITFVEPFQNGCASTTQSLKAVIRNVGSNSLTKIPIVVTFNGKTYSDTLKKTLKPDVNDTFTLSSTVNTSATGKFSISAYTLLKGDYDVTNDSFNKELSIIKTPTITAPSNATRCGEGNFTFTATSGTTGTKTYWYNSATSDSVVYVGNTFATPAVKPAAKSRTWYYQSTYTLKNSLKTKYINTRVNVGHMFDIKAKSSFIIDSFDIHMNSSTLGTKDSVDVYYRAGTYVGHETKSSDWIYVGRGGVVDAGPLTGTRLKGFGSIPMDAGNTYGVYLNLVSGNRWLWYDLAKTYSNADMTLICGASFGGLFSGATAGRNWDGEVYYHFKACATPRGSVTGTVYESPLGAKIKESTPFNGITYDGSQANPDLICPGDTVTYELAPPPPYKNSDQGTKWQITKFSFTSVGGAYPNPKDTMTTKATSSKNATFRFVPSKIYADSVMVLKYELKIPDGGCTGTLTRFIAVGSSPTANFTFNKVCIGKTTSFVDSSITVGSNNGYLYDFGDGSKFATTRNATHTYAKPGIYKAKLTVTTSKGCKDVITKDVEVFEFPKPSFSYAKVCAGNATQFTDLTPNSSTIASWLWKFDANDATATSTDQNPFYTYAKGGKYDVKLTITSKGGCSKDTTINIEVLPRAVVDFTITGACPGQPLTFTNTSTVSSGTVTYKWRFEDGFTSLSSTTVKHAFPDASTYGITLIATTAGGCSDSITKTAATFSLPKADFTSSATCEGDKMTFTNGSTDGKTYVWTFGDNSTPNNAQNPTYFYSKPGTYDVKLKTLNANGCADSITKTVTVSPKPKANFSFDASCAGAPVQFTDKSTEGNNGQLIREWKASNGQTSTDKDPVFIFPTSGTHNVQLKVTSPAGCVDSIQLSVNVSSGPKPTWKTSVNVSNKKEVTFTADNATNYTNFIWYFGDGDSSVSASPKHVYAAYGTYKVRLVALTTQGCVADDSQDLKVDQGVGFAEISNPKDFLKVYPNPFHNNTRISFSLKERSQVQVSVWDMQGKRVAILNDGNFESGKHEVLFDAQQYNAGPGMYMLKVLINNAFYTTQIVNMK
ncbi:MAG: PKD domain-containing protein [Sphingobacteriales bacterium]|nr:MAG: PKD domain-containing protein [Sphingobacteriales bacterium]